MTEYINQLFSNNQFLSGGTVLMIMGSAIALLRRAPLKLWNIIVRQFTLTVLIRNDNYLFNHVEKWLCKQRENKLRSIVINRSEEMGPAPGTHIFKIKNRWVKILRTVNEESNTNSLTPQEKFIITFYFCRNIKIVKQILKEIAIEACPGKENKIMLYLQNNSWHVDKRNLNSVFLPRQQKIKIKQQIRDFLSSREIYNIRGIPWRMGFILYGPPGNGKTSLVKAIASEFSLPLRVVSLSCVNSDTDLCFQLSSTQPCVIVIEDIDCHDLAKDRSIEKEKTTLIESRVTTSGLLNAIDGIAPSNGRILFLTTNHPEKLEPALLRPGRIDHKVLIDNACKEQAIDMFNAFFPNQNGAAEEFAKIVDGKKSMAELQRNLMQRM